MGNACVSGRSDCTLDKRSSAALGWGAVSGVAVRARGVVGDAVRGVVWVAAVEGVSLRGAAVRIAAMPR